MSVFATFFRICKYVDEDWQKSYAHALNWAISNQTSNTLDILLDQDSPKVVLDQLEKGTAKVGDDKLRSAMKEVLNKETSLCLTACLRRMPVPGTLNLDYENATVA